MLFVLSSWAALWDGVACGMLLCIVRLGLGRRYSRVGLETEKVVEVV